jgi:TatD DNase family protein
MLIDSHAHLNFKEFGDEIPGVIKRAELAGVGVIINVGSNFSTSKKSVELASEYQELFSSVGVHPIHLAKDIVEEATFDGKVYKFKTKQEIFDYEKYKKMIESSDKVVAIGETGLDYFRISESSKPEILSSKSETNSKLEIQNIKQVQKQVFEEHIKLAREFDLPLILHCRGSENNPYDAYDEMLEILNEWCHPEQQRRILSNRDSSDLPQNDKLSGTIHCFGGSLVQAKEFIKLGFYLGFTGIVTFKNALEIQEIASQIPLDKILIETDCPFLAPVPYRGKRNEPAYVIEVAKKIAELKNIPLEEVEEVTSQNSINLFKL